MGYERIDVAADRLELLRIYGYGLCMGMAEALPGISGGTVALLLGFYGRLIDAITTLTPGWAVTVLKGYRPQERERAREALLELDLQFLLPLGVGMITALVLITDLVESLAASHPLALFGFFTGLIAASAIALARSLEFSSWEHVGAAVAGTAFALLVAANVVQLPGSGGIVIFLAGTIAVSAMILPGISGALILILLGQYVFLSQELDAFVDALIDLLRGGSLAAVIDPGTTVILFVSGGVVGLLTISRLVRAALERRRNLTLVFLVSLIAGSTPAPLNNVSEHAHVDTQTVTLGIGSWSTELTAWTTDLIAVAAGWAAVGMIALLTIEYLIGGFDPE